MIVLIFCNKVKRGDAEHLRPYILAFPVIYLFVELSALIQFDANPEVRCFLTTQGQKTGTMQGECSAFRGRHKNDVFFFFFYNQKTRKMADYKTLENTN